MKYMRWALAFAMICGASYAGQALADSITLLDGATFGLGNWTKNYIFSSQADDTAVCEATNARLNNTDALDRATILVSQDRVSGKLLTITVTSLQTFSSNGCTAELSDVKNWNYFVQNGVANSAGEGVRQVTDSLVVGTNWDEQAARIGRGAFFAGYTISEMAETLVQGSSVKYDFPDTSAPMSPNGNLTIGNTFDDDADRPMLVAMRGINDDVKKPQTAIVVLFSVGTISGTIVLGMGLTALVRPGKE